MDVHALCDVLDLDFRVERYFRALGLEVQAALMGFLR